MEPRAQTIRKHLLHCTKAYELSRVKNVLEKSKNLKPIGFQEFVQKYPLLSNTPIPAVIGIVIIDAYHCTLTGHTAPKLDSLHDVAHKMGRGTTYRKNSHPCKAQAIFAADKRFWRVSPPALPPPTSAPQYFDQYLSKMIDSGDTDLWTTINTVKASRVTLGDRTPFQQEIGWIAWLSTFSKEKLQGLRAAIAIPSDDSTKVLLVHVVRCYLDRIFRLCTTDTAYVRERLDKHDQSSKRPRPFVGLTCLSSFYRYSGTLARILVLTMEAAADDVLPMDLSEQQRKCAQELSNSLKGKEATLRTIRHQLLQIDEDQRREEEPEEMDSQDGDDDYAVDEEMEEEAEDPDDDESSNGDGDCNHGHTVETYRGVQYRLIDKEGRPIPEAPQDLIRKVHALARALFTHKLTGSEKKHPAIVYSMVTALSEANEVKPPREICSLLARVQYCIRATVLFEVARTARAESVDYDSALDPLHRWVTSTHPCIFRAIRHGISLSAKACLLEVGLPKIMPTNKTGTEWDYGGESWDLAPYKQYITSLPKTCGDMIASLLSDVQYGDIWDRATLGPSGQGLREDVGKEKQGYSFSTDPKNGVDNLWPTLLRRKMEAGHLCRWFVDLESQDGGGKLEWNPSECEDFVKAIDDTCRFLHLATFESFSTPPRAEEFAATLMCDTSDRRRNLQLINGILTYILRYSKTTAKTGNEKPTCRVVPTSLKHLTLFFICVLRPIAWFLSTHVLKLPKENTEPLKTHLWWLVWSARYLDADDLTTGMRKEIGRVVDPKYMHVYGVRANRHTKKYLGRRFLSHHPTAKLINARAQNIFESQTGHSRAIAMMFYAKQGGMDHHPEIDARLLREHQCVGQAMLSILGFAPPPEGNLELDVEEPPNWVYEPVEELKNMAQLPDLGSAQPLKASPSVHQPHGNSSLENVSRANQRKRRASPDLLSSSEDNGHSRDPKRRYVQ